MTLTLKFSRVLEIVEVSSCKISSSWVQGFIRYCVSKLFLPYLATIKNPKIRSCDLDSGFRSVVMVQIPTKFHQPNYSGSWVIERRNFFALSRKGKEYENQVQFYLWRWNSIEFVWLSRYMLTQNFIKLIAAVHELCEERKNSDEKNIVGRYCG